MPSASVGMKAALPLLQLQLAIAVDPPKFASDFYVGTLNTATKLAGPTYDVKDGVCCPIDVTNEDCSATTLKLGSDSYEQGSKNRTRTDSPQGNIVSDYNSMKQMVIVPSNTSAHKWMCVQWQPLNFSTIPGKPVKFASVMSVGDQPDPPFDFTKPKPHGQGTFTQPAAVGGATKTCDEWKWMEKVAVIPMAFITGYVDSSSSTPSLFARTKRLLPVKGFENDSYVGFKPGAVDDSYFDIDPESIAKCPEEFANAESAEEAKLYSGPLRSALRFGHLRPAGATRRELDRRFAEAVRRSDEQAPAATSAAALAKNPNVSFIGEFTTTEEQLSVLNQYGSVEASGDLCCSYGSVGGAPQCQIGVVRTGGVRWMDVENQRTRYDAAGSAEGAGQVMDFKLHKQLFVGRQNGSSADVCMGYCPIDKRDVLTAETYWTADDVVHDMGSVMWHGQKAQRYHWVDKAGPVPLTTNDLYVDLSNPAAAIPLQRVTALTPLGAKPIETQNLTYSSFQAGPPDASKFDIQGVDTCPLSKNCATPPAQRARLALHLYHTYANYVE
jgi:hypothetical protein